MAEERENKHRIEIDFAAPVHISLEHQQRLVNLVGEICKGYEAKHPDRIMWPMGIGAKLTVHPMALSDDEPIPFDDSVFHIDCAERERYEGERR